MGYNTTILIINDSISDIEKNPEEFVKNLLSQIAKGEGDVKCGTHGVAAHVMKTENANVPRLYFTQGNWIFEVDSDSSVLVKAHRKELFQVIQEYLQTIKKKLKGFEITLKGIELKLK